MCMARWFRKSSRKISRSSATKGSSPAGNRHPAAGPHNLLISPRQASGYCGRGPGGRFAALRAAESTFCSRNSSWPPRFSPAGIWASAPPPSYLTFSSENPARPVPRRRGERQGGHGRACRRQARCALTKISQQKCCRQSGLIVYIKSGRKGHKQKSAGQRSDHRGNRGWANGLPTDQCAKLLYRPSTAVPATTGWAATVVP